MILRRSLLGFPAAVGDIDVDGYADLLATFQLSFRPSAPQSPRGIVMVNDGLSDFTEDLTRVFRSALPFDVEQPKLLDLDGDGDAELVGARGDGSMVLFMNNGPAGFLDVTAQQLPALNVICFASGDFDADSDIDLVVASPNLHLLLNDGAGVFTLSDSRLVNTPAAIALAIIDVDLDGDLDIASAPPGPGAQPVFVNDGLGNFTSSSMFPDTFNPFPFYQAFRFRGPMFMGDVSGDGYPDALVGGQIWIQDPSMQRFEDRTSTFSPLLPAGFGNAVDVDDDGDLDSLGATTVLRNDGRGHFVAANNRVFAEEAGPSTVELLVLDVDRDGDMDLVRTVGRELGRGPRIFFNHHRQLHAPYLARLGRPYRLDAYSSPGYATEVHQALFLVSGATDHLLFAPLGLLRIDRNRIRFLGRAEIQPKDGMASLMLNIPNESALLGLELFFQGVIIPSGNILDTRLTNTQRDVILPW